MDVQATLKAIRLLQQSRNASSDPRLKAIYRVASRWLVANMKDEYDAMIRLQILEGAAGVPVDTWWQKGRRGFKDAASRFSDTNLVPQWLEPKNSGALGIIERNIKAMLNSTGVPFDPMDIINNSLMGIRIDASDERDTQRAPYEAGKVLSKKISSGDETPASVAKGLLGTYLKRKVLNEAKRFKGLPLPESEEGVPIALPDKSKSGMSPAKYLSKLIWRNRGDKLSKAIRKKMRSVWDRSGKNWRETMLMWLDSAEKGRFLSNKELAKITGETIGHVSDYIWKKAWIAFFTAMWDDKRLMHDITERLQLEGVSTGIEKPDVNDPSIKRGDPMLLLRPKKKARTAPTPRQQEFRINEHFSKKFKKFSDGWINFDARIGGDEIYLLAEGLPEKAVPAVEKEIKRHFDVIGPIKRTVGHTEPHWRFRVRTKKAGVRENRPRSGGPSKGLRDGMAVELNNGNVYVDIRRKAPRDTTFFGTLMVRGTGEKRPLKKEYTFAESNALKVWRSKSEVQKLKKELKDGTWKGVFNQVNERVAAKWLGRLAQNS